MTIIFKTVISLTNIDFKNSNKMLCWCYDLWALESLGLLKNKQTNKQTKNWIEFVYVKELIAIIS